MSKGFSVFTAFRAKDGVSPIFNKMSGATSKFTNQLTNVMNKSKMAGASVAETFTRAKNVIGVVITAIAANQIKTTIDGWVASASDLQETIGKTNEVFKENAVEVLKWGNTAIKTMGLSKNSALDSAALFGDMATGMGLTTERAAEMSMRLVKLSADLSSFKNKSQSEMATALKGIFTGETEALKNIGTIMTQDVLENYAKELGKSKKFKDMTQQEKIELRFSYVLKSNKNADGDFLRTIGNYANQKRISEELRKEQEQNIGNIMLPFYNAFTKTYNGFLTENMEKITAAIKKLFVQISQIAKAFEPVWNELKISFNLFYTEFAPIIKALASLAKWFFIDVLAPALTGLLKTMNAVHKFANGLFNFIKSNWMPLLLTLPIAIIGVRFAIDTLRLKMALLRMEGGLLGIVMNTKLVTGLKSFTGAVWKSVSALIAQAAAFAMSPVGLITLGVAALVGVTILVWKNWDKITASFKNWWATVSPGLTAFWERCKQVFGAIGNFIKNNFINILLGALGPVGLLIKAVLKLKGEAKGVKTENIKDGEITEIKADMPKNKVDNTPKARVDTKSGNSFGGKIDVGVSIKNDTPYTATSSLGLQSNHGMQLVPVG